MLIGEIRDSESAAITCEAALTGHLVLSSVHAHTSYEVLLRLARLGVDSLTVAQTLKAICVQRLIPALCEKCKVIDLSLSHQYQAQVYRKVGCERCDYSGCFGVVLAAELFSPDDGFKELLYKNGEIVSQHWKALQERGNYFPLQEQIKKLIHNGIIPVATSY
jgi:type II secretory ATPase GspE/PulE/Tfp pilus assembly ATPase PilB-like protein